jgi:type VI secretion system protein ImpA
MIDEKTLERILTPISVANHAGEDLRYDAVYDIIKKAREEDDPNLTDGIWKTELKKADWNKVRKTCLEVLETRSKDLQVAIWLLESLLRLGGFAGVRSGLDVLNRLCEKFWVTAYPVIDEDGDMEFRLSPFNWMNEKLSLSLKFIPITAPPKSEDSRPCHLADMEKAKSPEAAEEKAVFEKSVSLTPESFYAELYENITSSLESLEKLNHFLDGKCGREAPSLRQFRDRLEDVQRFSKDKFSQEKKEEPESPPSEIVVNEPGKKEPTWIDRLTGGGKKDMDRDEAYKRLSEIANYLDKTEPHSPVPYFLKQFVLLKDKKMPDLHQELIKIGNEIAQFYKQ